MKTLRLITAIVAIFLSYPSISYATQDDTRWGVNSNVNSPYYGLHNNSRVNHYHHHHHHHRHRSRSSRNNEKLLLAAAAYYVGRDRERTRHRRAARQQVCTVTEYYDKDGNLTRVERTCR